LPVDLALKLESAFSKLDGRAFFRPSVILVKGYDKKNAPAK
jgi:hypothetical protein